MDRNSVTIIVPYSALGFLLCFLAGIVCLPTGLDSAGLQISPASLDQSQPSLNDLVGRMMAYRRWHDSVLREYQAHRRFHASNRRFNVDSTMDVDRKSTRLNSSHQIISY